LTTLYINFSVLLTSPTHATKAKSFDSAITILDDLTKILKTTKDSEAIYRALVAAGTLLSLGDEVQEAAKSIYDLPGAVDSALKKAKEPRIQGVVKEIRALLA
jgi:phospholipase A-2-activating protein